MAIRLANLKHTDNGPGPWRTLQLRVNNVEDELPTFDRPKPSPLEPWDCQYTMTDGLIAGLYECILSCKV